MTGPRGPHQGPLSPKTIVLKPGEFQTYRLTVPPGQSSLNGYLFVSEEHAKQWMAQAFVGPGFRAIPVIAGPWSHDEDVPTPWRPDPTRQPIVPGAGINPAGPR